MYLLIIIGVVFIIVGYLRRYKGKAMNILVPKLKCKKERELFARRNGLLTIIIGTLFVAVGVIDSFQVVSRIYLLYGLIISAIIIWIPFFFKKRAKAEIKKNHLV